MRRIRTLVVVLGLVGGSAAAQPTPTFDKPKKDEKAADAVEWAASLQGGLLFTSGNSRNLTFSGGALASRKQGFNKFSLELSAAYTRSGARTAVDADDSGFITPDEVFVEKKTTANTLLGKLRYDRFLTERDALYGTGKITTDKPAGKDVAYGVQVGYSRLVVKSDVHELAAEIGYDFTYEKYVAALDAVAIHSGRLFVGYGGKLHEGTLLTASGEMLANFNSEPGTTPDTDIDPLADTRIIGKLALSTQLSKKVALRFSFTGKFDAAPAPLAPFSTPFVAGFVPLADELDTLTELQLVVTLL